MIRFNHWLLPGLLLAGVLSCSTEKTEKQDTVSPETLSYFQNSPEEELKPTIWFTGDTTITNEDRLDLFEKHVRGLGGGCFGVGSSQNLSLAAWAKCDFLWLMDFTEIVVAANKINIAFLKAAENRQQFRRLWTKEARREALAIIEKEYANAADLKFIESAWAKSYPFQMKRYATDDKVTAKYNFALWLYDDSLYNHIRTMALGGRIRALKGDLRGPTTVLGIADAARRMNIVLRLVYFSNAEEYFTYGEQFRKNWTAIPVDEKSLIVRTISVEKHKFPWAPDSHLSTDRGFHYNIQPALSYQNWLKSPQKNLRSRDILATGQVDRENGFTLIPPDSRPPEV
ncbi:MAG: hypothetical protein HS115_11295 [Spirochaetales bacterium]|nr:hypothetical protein [Spirochaetales bacterium]